MQQTSVHGLHTCAASCFSKISIPEISKVLTDCALKEYKNAKQMLHTPQLLLFIYLHSFRIDIPYRYGDNLLISRLQYLKEVEVSQRRGSTNIITMLCTHKGHFAKECP